MGTKEASAGILLSPLSADGIDPLFSGLLYFISIPLFIASTAFLLRNIHAGKPVIVPAILSILFLLGSNLYLSSAGTVLPPWAYLTVATLLAFIAGLTLLLIRNQKGYITRRRLPRRRKHS